MIHPAPVFGIMARMSISLPESLIDKLENTKPDHLALSAHIRGLIYRGFEMVEMERKIVENSKRQIVEAAESANNG